MRRGSWRRAACAWGPPWCSPAACSPSLTPCVYPLIPITVCVFGARKAEGRGTALLLTSSYIVGMGVVFSALGVLAAKTGQAFGSMLGNPVVVTGLAVFLLAAGHVHVRRLRAGAAVAAAARS